MRIVVLACTLAVFLFFIALLNGLGRRSDQMRRRLEQVKDSERPFSDEELKKSFSERVFRPAVKRITNRVKQLAGKNSTAGPKKQDKKLDKQLKSAGINLNAPEFTFIKGMLALIFLTGGAVMYLLLPFEQIYKLLILIVMVCIPVYGASIYLGRKVKKRKEAIVRDLPDVMDLLVVSVEAGLGLDAAIVRQYSKNKCPVLAELNGAIREVQMGVPRKTAFRDMAERCDVKQLSAFVTALQQAEQLGVSIKSVLAVQADRLRTERKQRIQAKAMKAPVKIMLPTVAFIFPVIFIILLGPAAVNLITTFK